MFFKLSLLLVPVVAAGKYNVSVVEVNAAALNPRDYDAIIDVRYHDEYTGTTIAKDCSIGKFDSHGCLYGHVPDAIWMPEMFLCGGTTPSIETAFERDDGLAGARNCTDGLQHASDGRIRSSLYQRVE